MQGPNPNEAQTDAFAPMNGSESILPIAQTVTKNMSMEQLPYHKITPSVASNKMLKLKSIRSPFYKHPSVLGDEFRRAQTPNNYTLHNNFGGSLGRNNEVNFGTESIEDVASVRSKQSKFDRKHRFQCSFCLGAVCPPEDASKRKNVIVDGLNSNMILDKVIGSARPTKKKIEKFNIV